MSHTDPSINSPLHCFRFCPQCGTAGLEIRHTRSLYCAACGFRYFINSSATVGGFVFYEDRLILCERAEEPHKGKLGLPGGFVEFNESADEALHREISEELNIKVTNMTFLASCPNDYLYAGVSYKICSTIFSCRTDDISQMRANDDVADFCLIHPRQINPAELAFSSARAALVKLLAQLT